MGKGGGGDILYVRSPMSTSHISNKSLMTGYIWYGHLEGALVGLSFRPKVSANMVFGGIARARFYFYLGQDSRCCYMVEPELPVLEI